MAINKIEYVDNMQKKKESDHEIILNERKN